MDTKKIGALLKELRKDKGLTQEELGEKLFVTNKTISRWETGDYLPPIECIKLLCELYDISINQILAGERLSEADQLKAAEKNISAVLENFENKNKGFERRFSWMMAISTIITIIIIFLLPKEPISIIIIVLVIALCCISNVLNMVALLASKKQN